MRFSSPLSAFSILATKRLRMGRGFSRDIPSGAQGRSQGYAMENTGPRPSVRPQDSSHASRAQGAPGGAQPEGVTIKGGNTISFRCMEQQSLLLRSSCEDFYAVRFSTGYCDSPLDTAGNLHDGIGATERVDGAVDELACGWQVHREPAGVRIDGRLLGEATVDRGTGAGVACAAMARVAGQFACSSKIQTWRSAEQWSRLQPPRPRLDSTCQMVIHLIPPKLFCKA